MSYKHCTYNAMFAHLEWNEEQKEWSTKIDGTIESIDDMLNELKVLEIVKLYKGQRSFSVSEDNLRLTVADKSFGDHLKAFGIKSHRKITRIFYEINNGELFVPYQPQEINPEDRFNINRFLKEKYKNSNITVGKINSRPSKGCYIELPENMTLEDYFKFIRTNLGIEFTNNRQDIVPTVFRKSKNKNSKVAASNPKAVIKRPYARVEHKEQENKEEKNTASVDPRAAKRIKAVVGNDIKPVDVAPNVTELERALDVAQTLTLMSSVEMPDVKMTEAPKPLPLFNLGLFAGTPVISAPLPIAMPAMAQPTQALQSPIVNPFFQVNNLMRTGSPFSFLFPPARMANNSPVLGLPLVATKRFK